MHTSSTTHDVEKNLLLHTHAATLVAYARTNEAFRAWFQREIVAFFKTHTDISKTTELGEPSQWLTPKDTETAYKRGSWLLSEASRTHDTTLQRELRAWAGKQQEPKSIVIGLIGVAVPGPTLGILKKNYDAKMQIIVREDLKSLSQKEFAQLTQRASTELVAQALKATHGDAYRLLPDLADWFFGERALKITYESPQTLQKIQETLKIERLPHHAHIDEHGIAAIAIDPSVRDWTTV